MILWAPLLTFMSSPLHCIILLCKWRRCKVETLPATDGIVPVCCTALPFLEWQGEIIQLHITHGFLCYHEWFRQVVDYENDFAPWRAWPFLFVAAQNSLFHVLCVLFLCTFFIICPHFNSLKSSHCLKQYIYFASLFFACHGFKKLREAS